MTADKRRNAWRRYACSALQGGGGYGVAEDAANRLAAAEAKLFDALDTEADLLRQDVVTLEDRCDMLNRLRRVLDAALRAEKARSLELETRAQNAERALEQLQDEVVALRIKGKGSVHHSAISALLNATGETRDTEWVVNTMASLVQCLEHDERAATPEAEGGAQPVLDAQGNFVAKTAKGGGQP